MTQPHKERASRSWHREDEAHQEVGFQRHGPEPPENDSGPTPSVEEMDRYSDFSIENVEGDEQID